MSAIKRLLRNVLAATALALSGGAAYAVCTINGITSITPSTVNTGLITLPPAPVPQAINITVTGTYLSVLGGTCTGAVSFNRTSLPASMAISGGGSATLPYTIQSAPGGGNTLLYTGAAAPGAANRLAFTFPAVILGVTTPFSRTLTAHALAQPAAFQQGGSYSDSINLDVFNEVLGIFSKIGGTGFTVTGTVAKVCTINGVANPGADTATIPISAGGQVNTAPIAKSYANVACNTPSNLQLTSQNGAVKTGTTPVPGFLNLIDYAAVASFSGANATLNTAALPGAAGPEAGTPAATTGTTPTGTLAVTITPQSNASPLLAGSYQDTLRVTITPQ